MVVISDLLEGSAMAKSGDVLEVPSLGVRFEFRTTAE
jgi:hypothetical protein